jgi:hypothetical protein
MRLVVGDDGAIRWQRIVIMLAVTIASGYLASRSQRWGATAVQIPPRARYYHALQRVALGQEKFWSEIQKQAATRYDIARL